MPNGNSDSLMSRALDEVTFEMPGRRVRSDSEGDGAFAARRGNRIHNGVDYEFLTASTVPADLAAGLMAAVNADPARAMDATAPADDLILTGRVSGASYIAIEAVDSAGVFDTVTDTTPAASGPKRVDVTTNISADLLALASTLKLHPVSAGADLNEDFIVPLAATGGALTFSYKLDEERIYNVEFNAYPDDTQGGLLFQIGDLTAI